MTAQQFRPLHRRFTIPVALVALALLASALLAQLAGAASGASGPRGVLVVDNVYNNHLLDPQRENSSSANIALRAMYDTLVTFNGSDYAKVLPDLATSWVISPDGKAVTFNIRHGVVFSDGTPLTAKDVAFSFARVFNLRNSNSYLMAHVQLRSISKYQVKLTSDTPNPALIRIAANPALSVLNREAISAHGGTAASNANTSDTAETWVSNNSVGSGPYMLSSFTPNQEINLVYNPRYWGPKPRFAKVVIRNMPTASQLLNVQRGTAEVAVDIAPTAAASLGNNKAVRVVSLPGSKMFYLTVNFKPGVTVASNPLLLQAIRYGLDYNALGSLGGPQSTRLAGMIPTGLLGALPVKDAIQRNVAKAKQLIAQYGGSPPSFDVSYVQDFSFAGVNEQIVGEKVQSSLEAIGFKVNLVGRPLATHLAVRAAGGLQVNIGLQNMSYADPANYLQYCPGQPQAGYVAYTDAITTKLCNLAATTMSDKKRAAYFIEWQRRLNTSGPYIPIMLPPAILVGSRNLTGLQPNGIWNLDVAKIGTNS